MHFNGTHRLIRFVRFVLGTVFGFESIAVLECDPKRERCTDYFCIVSGNGNCDWWTVLSGKGVIYTRTALYGRSGRISGGTRGREVYVNGTLRWSDPVTFPGDAAKDGKNKNNIYYVYPVYSVRSGILFVLRFYLFIFIFMLFFCF